MENLKFTIDWHFTGNMLDVETGYMKKTAIALYNEFCEESNSKVLYWNKFTEENGIRDDYYVQYLQNEMEKLYEMINARHPDYFIEIHARHDEEPGVTEYRMKYDKYKVGYFTLRVAEW